MKLGRRSLFGLLAALPALAEAAPLREAPMPMVFGSVVNFEPVPIGWLVYRVHPGLVDRISAAHDGNGPLKLVGDFPDRASLHRALVGRERGVYGTCLRDGVLQLGDLPNGRLLVDVTRLPMTSRGGWDAIGPLRQYSTLRYSRQHDARGGCACHVTSRGREVTRFARVGNHRR